MSILDDPKYASRVMVTIGGTLLGLCARSGSQSVGPYWLIGMYVGFVMLIRGMWIAWKSRRMWRNGVHRNGLGKNLEEKR